MSGGITTKLSVRHPLVEGIATNTAYVWVVRAAVASHS